MFVFMGDTKIEGGSVEIVQENILAFYASGKLRMDGLYMEWSYQPDGIGFLLDNVTSGTIDRLLHVNTYRRLHVINGSNVHMRSLGLDGLPHGLRDCISVDGTSRVVLDTVNAQWDSGMLDHPRVVVRGSYNRRAERFVDTHRVVNGLNLLADPNLLSVSDTSSAANWVILWGDQLGAINGSWAVETVGGEKRLKLTVTENPNQRGVSVRVKLNVPLVDVGKSANARWRLEGPSQIIVYMGGYTAQYAARAMKGLTAVRTPIGLRHNEQIWIDIPQAAVGTYYISKVGMVVA
jgi:hypothetical protein